MRQSSTSPLRNVSPPTRETEQELRTVIRDQNNRINSLSQERHELQSQIALEERETENRREQGFRESRARAENRYVRDRENLEEDQIALVRRLNVIEADLDLARAQQRELEAKISKKGRKIENLK